MLPVSWFVLLVLLGDEAGACKGLSIKLKLATESLEQGRKSKSHPLLQQAKGRVELAKEFAATACTDAAKAKVGDALTVALSALEKVGQPDMTPKPGAAFQAPCRVNDDCSSEHCYVGPSDKGYCSKECSAPSDCPQGWSCKRPGSMQQTLCIK